MEVLLKIRPRNPAVGEAVSVEVEPGAAARVEVVDGRGLVSPLEPVGMAARATLQAHTPLVRIRAAAPGWEPAEALIRTRVPFGVMPNSIFESLVMACPAPAAPTALPNRLGPRRRRVVELSGEWAYQPDPDDRGVELGYPAPDLDDGGWPRMPVPSNFGRQDEALRDAHHPVWFRRWFVVPGELAGRRLFLEFEGVDYLARVQLNGAPLDHGGEHEGYCNPFRFDITDRVVAGENLLAVRVCNPWDDGMASAEAQGHLGACEKVWIKGILSYHDTRPGSINLTAADAQSRGTGGITRPVRLVATGEVSLDWVRAAPRLDPERTRGTLHLTAILFNHTDAERTVTLAAVARGEGFDAEHRAAVEARLAPGPQQVVFTLPVPDVRLWWPAGHPELGRPDLYALTVEVHDADAVLDERTEQVGFRDVTVSAEGEEPWIWRFNGRRLFLRGANLIPTIYLAESTPELLGRDLDLLREANLDSLILLDHHQPDLFYQACDARGVPVLQEFTLVWEYSAAHHARPCGDPLLTSNVEVMQRILAESLLYLGNHPSVVWWSLHDEPFFTFGVQIDDGAEIPDTVFQPGEQIPLLLDRSGNRDLDAALYATACQVERERPVHKTGNEGTESTTYYGWYTGLYPDLHGVDFPFPIEYGTEAVPFKAEAFIREHGEDLWPVTHEAAARAWMYRCLQLPYLSAHIGRTTTYGAFADWAFASQLYQALVLKYNVEYFRARRYAPTGSSYYFLFGSWWPSVTWGTLDDDRRPMLGYRWAAAANQPVVPFVPHRQALWSAGASVPLPVQVVNDLHRELPRLTLRHRLVELTAGFLIGADPGGFEEGLADHFWNPKDFREGVAVAGGEFPVRTEVLAGAAELTVPPDALVDAGELSFTAPEAPDGPRHFRLELTLEDPDGAVRAANWHSLAVVPDAASFRRGPGLAPRPRFPLAVRGAPGQVVRIRRRFGVDPEREIALDDAGAATLDGLPPGVYLVVGEAGEREVILDGPRTADLRRS